MLPDEYCQQKAAASGSSFYVSFRFLPADRRKAITALYAFCREVDDIVDDQTTDVVQARFKLDGWRKEIAEMKAGRPDHLITQALFPHLDTFNLDINLLLAIIDGMEMDLDKVRYETFDDLRKYCWHVASAVGILAARIFGLKNPQTEKYAEKLGLAFQLTNIIRDVGEDLKIGRIYLPADDLKQFGVSEDDLEKNRDTPEFSKLMDFQAKRALSLYDEAFALLPEEDRQSQRPGLMMASIYRELLLKIEKKGFPVLTEHVSLPKTKKLWLAWKAYIDE